jgi:hypothetical protein
VARVPRRLRAALLATLGLALGLACGAVWPVVAFAGPDASGWLAGAMIATATATATATADVLAVLFRLTREASAVGILVPAVAACTGFLVAGGALHGLGGGNPLAGPLSGLSQFGYPGI